MNVFVIFAHQTPFPGVPKCAANCVILHVVDSAEKAQELVKTISFQNKYEHVDFEMFELE